jgi:hypothetical protein
MAMLQDRPESPRYIKPVTEFSHLGNKEYVHEVPKNVILEEYKDEAIKTTSEAIEVEEPVSVQVHEGVDLVEEDQSRKLESEERGAFVLDDRSIDEVKSDEQEEDLYSISKFSL